MNTNALKAISVEETSDENRLDIALLKIQEDASKDALAYAKSAKVDLGGE